MKFIPSKHATAVAEQQIANVAESHSQHSPWLVVKLLYLLAKPLRLIWSGLTFTVLVVGFSIKIILHALVPAGKKWTRPFVALLRVYDVMYEKIVSSLDKAQVQTTSRSYFIELSFQNMKAKKTRTVVTVLGMAISIGFTVFLISLGYGMQNLVTTRVASLEELGQAEVVPGLSEELTLNDAVLSRLRNLPQVKSAIPLISVVGSISFQDSAGHIAVYGTTSEYLSTSAVKPIRGTIFDSHEISRPTDHTSLSKNSLAHKGGPSVYGRELGQIDFTIAQGSWLRVSENSATSSGILGFTRDSGSPQTGLQVYGDYYSGYVGEEMFDEAGRKIAVWIKSSFLLWRNTPCTAQSPVTAKDSDSSPDPLPFDPECQDGQYIPLRDPAGVQIVEEGFVAKLPQQIIDNSDSSSNILGEATFQAQAVGGGSLPLINDTSGSAMVFKQSKTVVEVAQGSLKEAVVNKAALTILGIPENQAVGKSITLSFVASGDLVDGEAKRIESVATLYKIVGVTPEEDTPVVYVPFIELRSLGISHFSQIKIIADNPKDLPQLRTVIESMGYGTVSVADTVAQIDNLFSSFRIFLGLIGLVALTIASLGMFNTLTVSLLERTREVGLLKAMGMKSDEVRDLFLTESMIMGFYGGVFGLLIGIGAGKVLSLIISGVTVARGIGLVDVAVVPPGFVIMVIVLAIIVGIFTGYYPARRATKISALNALRYE